jgi:hypothetical protein
MPRYLFIGKAYSIEAMAAHRPINDRQALIVIT